MKTPALDAARLREEFPILHQTVRGRPLVYLDNAATTQKPRAVIDALVAYYERDNANIHRGVHLLSQRATEAYEKAREKTARFVGAAEPREIVFTRGTTEAINLVAWSFGRTHVGAGDEVLISALEHHSNIVPWQMLCDEKGARLRVVPIDDDGAIRMDELSRLLGPRTKLLAIAHVSNALGSVTPAQAVCALARERGVPVLLDGAQAVAHTPVDVRALGCDFYAFSGHKLYGPTGVGALWARGALLDAMPPWQGGGDMIANVTFEKTTYNVVPHKFEAGTPDIAGVIGMGAAIDWTTRVGLEAIAAHEHALLAYATDALRAIPGLRLIGTARDKAAVLSFVMDGVHPHDVGTILDQESVAIRTGHHCAQPVMDRFGVPATARASFAVYNTRDDVDALVKAIQRVREFFA